MSADPPGPSVPTALTDWFLRQDERGNPDTRIDGDPGSGTAWSDGNRVRALVHGATYFRALLHVVDALGPGDLLMFTDWRGDPDQHLVESGPEVGHAFAAAARTGRGRTRARSGGPLDRIQFSAAENRHLGAEIEAAGGQCLLDMRVRPMGSHHQKLVVVRHATGHRTTSPSSAASTCATAAVTTTGTSATPRPSRWQPSTGRRPPWHDIQLEIRGPAVATARTVFRERWDDPAPLSRNPVHLAGATARRGPDVPVRCRRRKAGARPGGSARGAAAAHLSRAPPRVSVRPHGERSIARAYMQGAGAGPVAGLPRGPVPVVSRRRAGLRRRAAGEPGLHMIVVVPGTRTRTAGSRCPPNLVGRAKAMRRAAAPRRRTGSRSYSLENEEGTPIYVHAKVCIIDDVWACVGSDNANRRSWTHDSELSQRCSTRTASGPRSSAAASSPASTWAGRTSTISRLPLPCSRHSGTPPDGSTSGVAGPPATARQGSSAPTALRNSVASPGRGRRRSIG